MLVASGALLAAGTALYVHTRKRRRDHERACVHEHVGLALEKLPDLEDTAGEDPRDYYTHRRWRDLSGNVLAVDNDVYTVQLEHRPWDSPFHEGRTAVGLVTYKREQITSQIDSAIANRKWIAEMEANKAASAAYREEIVRHAAASGAPRVPEWYVSGLNDAELSRYSRKMSVHPPSFPEFHHGYGYRDDRVCITLGTDHHLWEIFVDGYSGGSGEGNLPVCIKYMTKMLPLDCRAKLVAWTCSSADCTPGYRESSNGRAWFVVIQDGEEFPSVAQPPHAQDVGAASVVIKKGKIKTNDAGKALTKTVDREGPIEHAGYGANGPYEHGDSSDIDYDSLDDSY